MQQVKYFRTLTILWVGLMVLVSGCNVAEQVGERVVEEAAEQVLGEGAIATSEAFTAAVATEAAALATAEAGEGEPSAPVESNTSESAAVQQSGQNDANSGADAGMGDDPMLVQPAMDLSGTLTGVQNGGDFFDVYQIQAGADQIVRLTVSSEADNSAEIWFDLGNNDGYDVSTAVMAGESTELVMGSSNAQLYKLEVSHGGDADMIKYRFDIQIEAQNDAGSADDAPDTWGEAMLISETGPTVTYRGASIGNETGANDFDCYQVNLPADNGSVTVDLTVPIAQPNEVYVRGELYDGAGELLTSNTAEFGSGVSLAFGAESYEEATAGNYSFCLESYSFYAYGEYEFTVTVTP